MFFQRSSRVRSGPRRKRPPCSPDPDLIEQAFAKLKLWPRAAQPRCRETLWRSVGDILDKFKSEECANDLMNAGYAST